MNNKFFKIYNDLVDKIQNGFLKPNSKLPSENDLTMQYDVSRETVRKALNMLYQNGYIQKIKGKGSVVLGNKRFNFPITGLVSFKELSNKLGIDTKTDVKELKIIKPDNFLMSQMNACDEDLWKLVRVRQINGENVILDKDYIIKKYVPELTKEVCRDSIYEYFENKLKIMISFAKKIISVEDATDDDKKYLDLGRYDIVVVVKNYVYLNDITLFQYTESRHRPDKFIFEDFARRMH